MNARDRDFINSNREELAKTIDLNDNFINQVINKNIFTQKMMDDIKKVEDLMDRKRRFIFDLTRRGPEACDQLVEILYGIGQVGPAKLLRPESFRGNTEQVIENITSPLSPPIDSAAITVSPLVSMASNEMSSNGSHTVSEVNSEEFMTTVQTCKKAFVGPNIYRQLMSPRGYCLIFNIHKFKSERYDERKGSLVDTNRLRDVFIELHYTVKVFKNSTIDELKDTISEYSKDKELKNHDSIIIIVLSHGQSQYVITSDGFAIAFEDIVRQFNNENCPLLIGKPKLFFFNCCRGDEKDKGPSNLKGENAVSDAKTIETPTETRVPTANDIMICYSTVDGYVSWRNEESGSWFCTAIAQAIMKHSHDKELHHILTSASFAITQRITKNGEKQVMEHVYRGFRKLFYFNPGIQMDPFTTNNSTSNGFSQTSDQ